MNRTQWVKFYIIALSKVFVIFGGWLLSVIIENVFQCFCVIIHVTFCKLYKRESQRLFDGFRDKSYKC